MKKCFYSLIVLTVFLFTSSLETKAQTKELIKAEQTTSVKKAETNTSTSGGDTAPKTKIEQFGTPSAIPDEDLTNPSKATQDQSDYQDKKTEWIKEHPAAYKKYANNPNLVILTENELNALSAEEQARILADEINYLIIRQ